ncbi:MAG: H-NS family nucleoid-associated regulatory protein [Bradyrhizobium sp.]
MEKLDLEGMPLDDLWTLHEQISSVLSARIIAEKEQLENRLVQLNRGKDAQGSVVLELKSSKTNPERPRRKYPKVFPKYQNPAVPSETWSGRGKQPRWLVSALKAGGKIEAFIIPDTGRDKVSVRR